MEKIEKEKILFIVNPVAGQGKIISLLDLIIPEMAKGGSAVTVIFTEGQGDIERIVKEESASYDRIFINGGDGSLNELANGYMFRNNKDDLKLAYIPTGTTCDFAINFEYPETVQDIVKVGREGEMVSLDLGLLNKERHFVYVASFGAFTDSSYGTPTELKNSIGRLAYVLSAVKNMQHIVKIPCKIILEDQVLEEELLFAAVLNSIQMGGIVRLNPETLSLQDGFFELIAVRFPTNIADLSIILNALMNQDFSHPLFICKKVKQISFEFLEKIAFTMDGEFGGELDKIDIEVLDKAWHLCR